MRAVDILKKKRSGQALGREEIAFLINGFTAGEIPRYQMSAFLMAVSLQGMSEEETLALTETMLGSGSILNFDRLPAAKVDKHSTGGVGDKTSLVVAPLAAAAGVVVPMITGRALGHTGGTLDKLESIPGFDVRLETRRLQEVVSSVGCAIVGQTEDIAPADRKLYSLRDVTATIDSLPLITASILSKKLAEGISGLVLDVKVGSGAFMKSLDEAHALAELLLVTAKGLGTGVVALVTDMEQPLGRQVGNALEVEEAIAVLKGEGPEDITQLSIHVTAHMLVLGGASSSLEDAELMAEKALRSGRGLEKLGKLVAAQGGDRKVIDDEGVLPRARNEKTLPVPGDGYVGAIDTEAVGRAAMLLGAGRQRVEDAIDPAAGLVVHAKLGDDVRTGDPLVTIHYNDGARLEEAEKMLLGAYRLSDAPHSQNQLVHAVLTQENQEGTRR